MSNQEFENYVALIGKLLQLTREQREQISGELQDHLQMRVADLMSEGVAKQDAVAKALEEFGDAAVMAKNFQTVINLEEAEVDDAFCDNLNGGRFSGSNFDDGPVAGQRTVWHAQFFTRPGNGSQGCAAR